jgi:hypothetical protein
MFSKYHCIKKIVLVLLSFFFSGLIHAQSGDQPDTTRLLSRDMDSVAESLEPPRQEPADENSKDRTASTASVYFVRKELQANGGRPDSLQFRKLPDSLVKKLQQDDDFWYANYPFEKKEEKKRKIPFTQQPLFQIVLWLVIIGGFAAFVMIYLANSNAGLFRRSSKALSSGDEADADTGNIFEINYQREIDKAISNGNYRLAIRLMFLRLLKNLSDRRVIEYKQDRTNFDYLAQLHSTKYYTDFFRLTRNYEYSWYGQFDIEPEKFTIIKKDFENFDRNLNNH